jgi:hypothetical protein
MEEKMIRYSDVVIAGAGAAGLMAGGLLASHGISVTILEKNNRIGKKLAATGNGRCNFTNRDLSADKYYGDRKWIARVLDGIGADEVIGLFEKIGVYHREKDGYVYPYTNQASTVTGALEQFCRTQGVKVILDCKVTGIHTDHGEDDYCLRTPEGEVRCRYAVLALGGKASAELGGDGSGYKLARSLGHSLNRVYPGLTGLICEGDFWHLVAGTRIQGRFSLLIGSKRVEGECGEIQITKDGVSGIPVFQLCRVAAEALAAGQAVQGEIDFVPAMEEERLSEWIQEYGMDGLVQKKWCDYFRRRAGSEKKLKAFRFDVRSTFGMERAQVTAGGIRTEEVNPETMESNIHPRLFLAGEMLDVDGKCGGYNLHFAWACACRTAKEIIRQNGGKDATVNTVQDLL